MIFAFTRITLFVLLFLIALLHFYWAFGGRKMLRAASPRDLAWFFNLKTPLRIALSLLVIAPISSVFLLCALSVYPEFFPFFKTFYSQFYMIAAGVFMLRGVAGPLINMLAFSQFFKSHRQQNFVDTFIYWNSYVYSPLAFVIGLLFLVISYF